MDFSKIDEGHPEYKEGEAPFHYYYNRAERIAKAPQIVQDYYNGKGPRPVKGLFKSLVSTRGNRFMLSSIVIFAAFIWIFSFFSRQSASKIAGTSASLSAFSFEESVYASLKFDAVNGAALEGGESLQVPVTAVFTAYEVSGEISNRIEIEEIFYGDELFIRTKFTDYDIIKVICDVTAGAEKKSFSAKIEHR